MGYAFNPFTGNFDQITAPGSIPDPLTVNNLTVSTLLTAAHIHGNVAGSLYIHVKNTSNTTLAKGTPVYAVGAVGDTTTLEVAAADSADPAKSPAIGILDEQLIHNASGHAVMFGEITGVNTGGYAIGDELYLASGGGLTSTRPTSGYVQSLAVVGRVHASTGTILVWAASEIPPTDLAYNAATRQLSSSTGQDVTLPLAGTDAGLLAGVSFTGPSGWTASGSVANGTITLSLSLPAGSSLVASGDRTAWDTAYAERLRWDGGSTGLNASTARTSLGLGTAATTDASAYATAVQGAKADTAVQPGSLATVATTGSYADLSNRPTLGTFAAANAATPPAIGGTTPAAGAFTDLSASASLLLPGAAPSVPAAGHVYRSTNTLRYSDSTGAERLILNAQDNLANLADAAVARSNLGAASTAVVTTSTAGLMRPVDLGDVIVLACSDETTDLATGTARVTFRMPWAATLTAVRLSVNTAPTGSALIVDVNEGGASVFATRPQIDAGAGTSVGSSVTPVISDSALAADAEITVDIDQVGSTIKGKGLKVALHVTRVQP